MKLQSIPVAQITANPDQPRKTFSREALDELAASIQEIGLLQPIVVRLVGDAYQIVAGERRWRATGQTDLTDMPCIVVEANDDETLVLATAENVNRRDMTVVEEAKAYERIVNGQGRTVAQVAKLFGKSTDMVQTRLDILALDETILDMLDKGHITKESGWYLSRLSTEGQRLVWRRFTTGELVDEAAMRHACRAQRTLESEPAMFVMEDEAVIEKRREVKTIVDKQLANVKRSHDALDKLMDISDEDLVIGLGQGLDDLAAALQALEAHARTVRNRIDRTNALREQHAAQ
ncbi:MAG: hypothetical protein DRJ50_09065 [Actinobacteria bacterium]|nr:MAG: hypothetical protein DRJ50_09065 [Actinomycetota bacterium]